ncbi:hypothetical protein [Endozoicomonas sp. 4G]|uniref:hypothetical protein n=1 Tax=Endozoicomonas sp. 4G TaxID=2872754 RepID=UPI00207903AA|nr:hypothetical protein [Endozoicomonas sp. 4G]
MKRVLVVLTVLVLSIVFIRNGVALTEEQDLVGLTDLDVSSGDSSVSFEGEDIPGHSTKAINDQYNLVPFKVSEDNYTDSKKKLTLLWARATFLDGEEKENGPQPALFPLNTAYNPAYPYGYATQDCISPLPAPLTKKNRCNDQQLTGFCRVKIMMDNETGTPGTLVGMLANTPDNFSGCLLSSLNTDLFLQSLGDENLLPRDILVTDKEYYQINVSYGSVSYQFREEIKRPVPFASTVRLSGSLRHETLCKNDASPGIQWYSDGTHKSEYGCTGLTAGTDLPSGNLETPHFVPVRQKPQPSRSPVAWQASTTEESARGTNLEVQQYFCSPKKPYKEFILGSLAGQGPDKYCAYIGTSGKSGYVATNQDGSIASDYLRPVIDGYVSWQAFEDDLPDKAVIAGYSVSDSDNKISKVPQYFCRFMNNDFETFGKYFEEDKVKDEVKVKVKVCKASFATPSGESHALVDSKTFEILVMD